MSSEMLETRVDDIDQSYMFPRGQHPIYSYTEEDRLTVLKNVGIKEAQLRNDAKVLKDWFQKQPHLAEAGIDIRMAELCIILAKGSVERCKQRLNHYYKQRSGSSVIHNRIELLENLHRPVWDTHIAVPAPKLYNGSRVTYVNVFDWSKFTVEDCLMNMAMLADIRCINDLISSDIWIIDLNNATLGQIISLNFIALGWGYLLLHEGLGLRLSAIHIVNCTMSSVAQAIVNLCKPFLSKKMVERLKFHETLESLYDYVPKEYLSKDCGGVLESFEVYKAAMEELITSEKTKQFLLDACRWVSDESKRPTSTYNEDCLEGNFKKLEFD